MDELIKQLELLNKNVDNLNESLKGMLDDKKLADESSNEIEEISWKYLYCDSVNFLKDEQDYIINTNFVLDKEFISTLNELKDRKIELGVIYGEYNPDDNFSVSDVSHIIKDIKISDVGLDMVNVDITCQVLNTHYGERVRNLIDEGNDSCLDIRLKYITVPDIKIFTVDIVTKK